jgi:hypothetical protein
MPPPIPPPSSRHLIPPLLASLPAAAVSPQPPTALLPLLTPILRQRVQILSASSTEPWLLLLCYDQEKVGKLSEIAKSDKFEPHPVSGEVEVDWDSEVETRYKRVDEETLEAYVTLQYFMLRVKLLYCIGDQEGGGDGWRIGEVTVADTPAQSSHAQLGWDSIGEAEGRFRETAARRPTPAVSEPAKASHGLNGTNGNKAHLADDEDDDDDAYWAQYDNTPARTPAPKHSPAPDTMRTNPISHLDEEAAYYAQYATVQPAMDSHDPDEASAAESVESTLGTSSLTADLHRQLSHSTELSESSRAWSEDAPESRGRMPASYDDSGHMAHILALAQPRPKSSSSSSSAATVEKLEHTAASQVQSEIGVKQHISTSVTSLYRLARAAGVEREEFERLVRTELDVLGLMEEDD